MHIVHNGMDIDQFQPKTLKLENLRVRILSVGSLIEKKGHKYLIDTCALLAENDFNFLCSIIGTGRLQKSLRSRIKKLGLEDQVLLVGAKNQSDVLDLYCEADIFVLACVVAKNGDRDGMPNVLLEAMAMQIPVVTTPVAGIPELVHNGENGILVLERDVNALADAVELLIINDQLRHELGKSARETICNEFDIQKTTARMAANFRLILEYEL